MPRTSTEFVMIFNEESGNLEGLYRFHSKYFYSNINARNIYLTNDNIGIFALSNQVGALITFNFRAASSSPNDLQS